MAITAQLHDGTELEFPDGTDPAVVQRTVKSLTEIGNYIENVRLPGQTEAWPR